MSPQVSVKFSSVQQLPADKTTLSLKAQAGSLCSVRAIDQSVLLLQAEEELSVDSVGLSALAVRPVGEGLLSAASFLPGLPAAALPEAVRVPVRRGGPGAVSLPVGSSESGAGETRPLQALLRLHTLEPAGRRLQHLQSS